MGIFWRQNILDIFEQHFLLAYDFGLDKIWEMFESYTTSLEWMYAVNKEMYA